jgi:hypothetical protein
VAIRTTLPLDAEALRHLAAALGTYWEQPAEVRAALVAGLPALIDGLAFHQLVRDREPGDARAHAVGDREIAELHSGRLPSASAMPNS